MLEEHGRRTVRRTKSSVFQGLWGLICAGTVGITSMNMRGPDGHLLSFTERGPWLVLALVAAVLVVRAALSGVELADSGIRVRKVLSSRRLRWGDVKGFRLGRSGIMPNILLIDLVDGSSLSCWCISGSNPSIGGVDRVAEGLKNLLNDELERHRDDGHG